MKDLGHLNEIKPTYIDSNGTIVSCLMNLRRFPKRIFSVS